jgi:hypothetical protein
LPADRYATIKLYRDTLFPGYIAQGAKLITQATGGAHYGTNFLAADVDAIKGWLATELLEADPGSEEPTTMAAWSGCMELADWDAEAVADGWANKEAQGEGPCEACHNLGAERFIASDNSLRVFDAITTDIELMPSYFTVDALGTTVIINRVRLENVGNRLPPHQEHGDFDVDGDAMERLQRFYDLTMAREVAGLCGPPKLEL